MSGQTPPPRSRFLPHPRRLQVRLRNLWHRSAAWILGPAIVGAAAVGLALGSEHANHLSLALNRSWPYAPLVVMPAGFALLVWITRRWLPGSQGSGIPQTIAAINVMTVPKSGRLLSLRIAIGKIAVTMGGLALGASIGREGPTVQIGASIMHSFYGFGPFQSPKLRRALIAAGGAAGIAAAFNTPLAGIMFAIEELGKRHPFKANSSVLLTVIMAGLISLAVLGNYTYFGATGAHLDWQHAPPAILACGLLGGLAGGLFSRLMIAITFHLPAPLARLVKTRPLAFAACCGLFVAILGLACDGAVFGTGYQVTRATLEAPASALPWYFGAAKLLATLVSAVAGFASGIFAPSLTAGAGFGDNLAALFPALGSHGAIVLLTMAAYLSGVTRAPLTSFIIVMEMTNGHALLVPLMAVSLLASAAAKWLCPVPLYEKLAENFAAPPPAPAAIQASQPAAARS